MIFQISIANICIRITSIYRGIYELCQDYLDDQKEPELSLVTVPSDLQKEAKICHENWPLSDARAAYMESLAVHRKLTEKFLDYDILLMHGVVLDCSGSGIMITAPSGVGKTTRANIWTSCIPHTYVVNGDKPFLGIGECVTAYGTPWNGRENMGRNVSVPLRAILLLSRSTKNQITRVRPGEVLPLLMRQVFLSDNGIVQMKILSLLNKLCRSVPVYRMECDRQPESMIAIYQTLCKDGIIHPEES